MKTFARIVALGAAVGLVLSLLAPLVLGNLFAKEVLLVSPAADEAVAVNKELWLEGDPVAEIYGTPTGQQATLVFPDESKIIVPTEDPSIVLYTVDKQKGENPLQLKTVWFVAKRAAIGFGLALLVAAGAFLFLRRQS